MTIQRFEEIEGWQAARELVNSIYDLTMNGDFAMDFGLCDQIRRAAGSSMHNIAEGFDAGSNTEFVRFLRYSQRSCTEVKSQLYLAKDRKYISEQEFSRSYRMAETVHSKVGGFINYLLRSKRQQLRTANP